MRVAGSVLFLSLGLVLLMAERESIAETVTVGGWGEAAVRSASKKDLAQSNKAALAEAEDLATKDALSQAVFRVYGPANKLGPRAQEILDQVHRHSAPLVSSRTVTKARVAEGKATVEVSIQVDAAALRTYLEESLGLSLSREQEGKFRVFVLAYTVEGMDPSRTQPNVLREEVEDNKKNVQHDKKSNSSASSSSSSKAESLAVDASMKDKGSVDASQSASLAASGSRGTSLSGEGFSGKDSASGKVNAKESGSASAKWDQEAKLKADASTASSSASAKRQSSSNDNFSDTSTFYRRLVIYEDTSKKGAGSTNEVRAKLGELLKSQGLTTGFLDVRLMGRQFQNEDEIYAAILQELEKRPEVGADDYVAVALNRLTPIKAEKPRFSAQVT